MESISLAPKNAPKLQLTGIIKEIIYWGFIIGAIIIKCFYFQFTTRINSRPFSSMQNIYMLISTFATIIILCSIVFLVFKRKRLLVLLILDILLSLILAADTFYTRYYTTAISIPVLFAFKFLGDVTGSVSSLIRIKDIVFVMDIPIVIAFLIYLSKKGVTNIKLSFKLITAAILIVISMIAVFFVNSNVDVGDFVFDNNDTIKLHGIFYYHGTDIGKFIHESLQSKKLTSEEKNTIDSFFNAKKESNNKYSKTAQNMNLLIVQVESLQGFVINKTIEGQEITPNLNKYINDSLYFDNFYYQVEGGNTSDAEFLVNASVYPVKEGAVALRFPTKTYHTLPQALKEKGYSTSASHAFLPSFWNRAVTYPNLGIDRYFSYNDFKLDEFVGWGGYALSDTTFFRQSLDKIDTTKPFYSMMITLSSHNPYDIFSKDQSFKVGQFENTYLGNYLKAIHYVDSSIGKLIDDLKKRGLYDNTLLVIYGDHYAIPKMHEDDLFKFLGVENNSYQWKKLQKVPLFIHNPGVKNNEVVHKTAGQIDLFPTIANMMGIKAPYAMGKDIFENYTGYANIRNMSVVTDQFLYDTEANQVYDIQTGAKLNLQDYDAKIKEIQKEREISETIIKKNAFKK